MNEHTLRDERHSFEELLADWLECEAVGEAPDRLLESTFEATRHEPQHRGLRMWLARFAAATARRGGGARKRRFEVMTAFRVATAALLIAAMGTTLVLTLREGPPTDPAGVTDMSAEDAQVTSLFEVTLDAEAIPDALAGILVFRKIYPTDLDISYVGGFIPPNTFVRHVESGELGIRPVSEVRIIRSGSSWADAEIVAAGDEAVVGPGDTFVMHDVPWDEYGPQALGEMWTPGEDVRVVGFAIRESSRCCAMTHAGMQSPWYHTLLNGVQELRGQPVTLTMLRSEIPVGAELPQLPAAPTLAAVDAGAITATIVPGDAAAAEEPTTFEFGAGRSLQLPKTVTERDTVRYESTGTEPAVVYQLTVEPGDVDDDEVAGDAVGVVMSP